MHQYTLSTQHWNTRLLPPLLACLMPQLDSVTRAAQAVDARTQACHLRLQPEYVRDELFDSLCAHVSPGC